MCERTWPLGAPLDEGACEQQAIQRPQEKIILLGGRDGLRRLAQIRTYAIYQKDEYSLRTSKFESDMPSHGVGLTDVSRRCSR
jgi:hypothetical protein